MQDAKKSIVIVDDETMFRQGLECLLCSMPNVKVLASVAAMASPVREFVSTQPDVLIAEADLHTQDAFTLIQQARMDWPAVKSILLARRPRERHVYRARAMRVDGLVSKRDSFSSLCRAIDAVVAGRTFYSQRYCNLLGTADPDVSIDGLVDAASGRRLTNRESEVLFFVASGLTLNALAERMGITRHTADNHKTRLMRKLDVHSSVELVRYAVREGIIDP